MMVRYENAVILTMDAQNRFYSSGYIDVDGDTIVGIGQTPQEPLPSGSQTINLSGRIIMPGLISAHCHFYGQFGRGMPLRQSICNWQQVLTRMWWQLDKALDDEMTYYSAMLGLVEGLKAGTTTYFDHQASPNAIDGCLDIVESAVRKAGARACLCYEVTGRDGEIRARKGVDENLRFISKCTDSEDKQVRAMFGLHASYSMDQDLLLACAGEWEAAESGFHLHVAEDRADVADCYKRFDRHVVERLYEAGIFSNKTIAAHGVHLSPREWRILRDSGVTVAHNCQSNMNNGVGLSPVADMLEDGVRVAMGGDGYTYDLFKELGIAVEAQRAGKLRPDVMSDAQTKALLVDNNARLAGAVFKMPVGCLETGATADFLILDYDPMTPLTAENALGHLMSAFSGHVDTVVVGGQTVVQDGVCTLFDEHEIAAACRIHAKRLWDKLG